MPSEPNNLKGVHGSLPSTFFDMTVTVGVGGSMGRWLAIGDRDRQQIHRLGANVGIGVQSLDQYLMLGE